ncbi:stage III sporulation protein AG [Camelliibacillus cellulosilyticus]|uniref:Stage III sporulation protein AG n=1 Tax=Camelliibacillus cellulosilyticus TaxID=2174486 RepID=A0ABV9GJ81_9BACL
MSPRDLWEAFTSRFLTKKGTGQKKTTMQTLVILLLLGIGLMLLSHFYGSRTAADQAVTNDKVKPTSVAKDVATFKSHQKKSFNSMEDYATYYQERLKELLNKVMGVSNVDVMIMLDTSVQNIYEKDNKVDKKSTSEEDQNGGTRESNETTQNDNAVIIDGSGGKTPLIITEKSPIVRGVAVTADGVQNPTVKSWIIDVVSSVLDVPSYKVSVVPAKSKEDS